MYIRFSIHKIDESSCRSSGLFQAIYELIYDKELFDYEEQQAKKVLSWFNDNLDAPTWLAKSKKPNTRFVALSWFKDTAVKHIQEMRKIAVILDSRDITVTQTRTDRPGYIVYEDDYQVAAEPYSDTFI